MSGHRQLHQLKARLDPLIEAGLLGSKLCKGIAETVTSQQKREGQPIALSNSFGLRMRSRKGKEFIGGWLNYQISFAGDGLPTRDDGQPCGPVLHVAHWACEFAFEYDAYVGFPATQWQPWQLKEGSLLWWEESDSSFGPEWTYTLDIAALADDGALQAAVIAPALALLAGKPAIDALPASTPGLLRYRNLPLEDGGTDLRVY